MTPEDGNGTPAASSAEAGAGPAAPTAGAEGDATACPALDVRNVQCSIGGTVIVRDVTFTVPTGAALAIVGPNGAGKTTLLKCLNRILPITAGSIRVRGRALDSYAQTELATEIGYVPQGGADGLPFSVFEFVMMGRYPHLSPFTSPGPADDAAVMKALRMAGVDDLSDRICSTLSGGERQKVLIAAALAQDAQILILDEPTTYLDPHHQSDILRLLARLNRDSCVTLVTVTHDINAAALCSDRILALRDGQVVLEGIPDDVMTVDVLKRVFGQSFHFTDHPVTGQRLILPEAVRRA